MRNVNGYEVWGDMESGVWRMPMVTFADIGLPKKKKKKKRKGKKKRGTRTGEDRRSAV